MYGIYDDTKGDFIDKLRFNTYDEAFDHLLKHFNITEDQYNSEFVDNYVWVATDG